MFLVIDIGNTTMEFGVYDGKSLAAVFRLGTKRDITSDEVGLFAGQFFEMQHIPRSAVTEERQHRQGANQHHRQVLHLPHAKQRPVAL